MRRAPERPISAVPRTVLCALALLVATQIALRWFEPVQAPSASDLAEPPSPATMRLAGLGDPVPVAKALMLYLQSFDYRGGNLISYQDLDYSRLERWLGNILELDPEGQYPLMAASRLYAQVPQQDKQRQMLEFVYQQFFKDPDRRWRWLAEAAAVAKHRLHDLPLALKYAAAIQQHATGAQVPLWARQMQAFILEDMNELETARIMIGGYIDKGLVKDPGELRYLEQHLNDIEARMKASR